MKAPASLKSFRSSKPIRSSVMKKIRDSPLNLIALQGSPLWTQSSLMGTRQLRRKRFMTLRLLSDSKTNFPKWTTKGPSRDLAQYTANLAMWSLVKLKMIRRGRLKGDWELSRFARKVRADFLNARGRSQIWLISSGWSLSTMGINRRCSALPPWTPL